ncbi:MAG: DUF1444 family protein [Oscillochloridaceae bacterium umkhey_bin13]
MSHEPLLDPETFAALAEARLSQTKGLLLQQRAGLTCILRVGQSDLHFDLAPFYARYQERPDQLGAILQTMVRSAQGYGQTRHQASFEQLRERILPMLKPLALLATVHERQLPMLVYRPFLADLMICYVVDEPGSLAYLNEQHLERWGLAEHELYVQALANLRVRTIERGSYTVAGVGTNRLIILNSQDGFDATRLLLPDLIEQWAAELPSRLVIGIPDRDFMIIFSDADRSVLAGIAHQIQLDAAQREHGLTDQLFTLEAGQVRTYAWE